jgi:chemosensory pili system protein ChpA (sensor histidine kinase/response regulator)
MLEAMLVRVDEQAYAIPMAAVDRVVRTPGRPTPRLGQVPSVELDGESLPYLELARVLGREPAAAAEGEEAQLVLRTGERKVVLSVSELLGQEEIVVKSLGPHLRAIRGVLGATIQANGQVLPVLNTAELLTQRALVLGGRAERPTAAQRQQAPRSALVVDDSLSVRKVLARTLERDGWIVRQARDGLDALEVLQGFRPDVVLMDIEMPRMDGFELAAVLRDGADYGDPPIVMITSRAGDKHRKRAEELGVAGYVVKPYQEQELLAMLHRLVSAHGRR